ncbi:SAM-dependent methyltransferase [Streptomyces sp. ACA25]|uniref:SAM-dependent methyltransferase n=1 Tax=Streptomyces sp. ACA25 TaxID=3022596 RepID=UPI0023075C0F|nr:SAM-dependent methyltransferase [Streptomyces sp. ACA25]MDB1089197.1 SAM-dependent methyltransferase [Streptomyces sp. ACA25]
MTHASVPAGPPPKINRTVPHSSRVWHYLLGGKDAYEVDRAAGDRYRETFPAVTDVARAARDFQARALRCLTVEEGIRQFLDVGIGLPVAEHTHQTVQRLAPAARIVYADNDPLVLAHARALFAGTPGGAVECVEADLHAPGDLLRRAARTLDLRRPVALILGGVLGHVEDTAEARSLVRALVSGLPAGSCAVISDGTALAAEAVRAQREYNDSGAVPYHLRTPEEISGYFDGLELMEPGVVSCPLWRPASPPRGSARPVDAAGGVGGVGRKPWRAADSGPPPGEGH